jgi:hypothetical protein
MTQSRHCELRFDRTEYSDSGMKMQTPFTGTCQCGEVRYVVKSEPIITVACHCRDCQKLSASAFSLTMLIPAESFELISGNLQVFERPVESGGSALCYFCSTCGNRVYHGSPQLPGYYRLKPGGLDDTSKILPQAHVWTSRAQPWYEFPDGVPVYETQPDLKEFLAQKKA